MDGSVRTALTNLMGMLDEGFITQNEYDQRRKTILDKATGVQPTGKDEISATGRTSVFDRLGASAASEARSADTEGTWGHDGYQALYGGGGGGGRGASAAPRQQSRVVTVVGAGKAKGGMQATGDLRAKLKGIQKGDLRNKLRQGATTSKMPKKLPEKCPW